MKLAVIALIPDQFYVLVIRIVVMAFNSRGLA
jgi:hypothetical protein